MMHDGCSIKNIVVEALDSTVVCVTYKFALNTNMSDDNEKAAAATSTGNDDDDGYKTFHFIATIDNAPGATTAGKIIGIKPMTSQAMMDVFKYFMKNYPKQK